MFSDQLRGGNILRYLMALLLLTSCTVPQLGEVRKRVQDSLSGQLSTPGDLDPDGTNNFSFAVFGDTHVGSPMGSILNKAIQSSKAAGDSFVVVAGDLTDYGKSSQFDEFISAFNSQSHIFRAAIGNHDIYFNAWKTYKNKIGAATYSFNADHVHFAVIDTANGVIGKKQLNWLRQDLASTSQSVKIIVSHFSPYTGEFQQVWRLSSEEETAILKDIANTYNVSLVIAGHYHGFVQKRIHNTIYLTTGGVNKVIDVGEKKHYVRVRVNATNISIRQIKL